MAELLNYEQNLQFTFNNIKKEFDESPSWSVYNMGINKYNYNNNNYSEIIVFKNRKISQEDLSNIIIKLKELIDNQKKLQFNSFMSPDFILNIQKENELYIFNISIDFVDDLNNSLTKKGIYGNNYISFKFKTTKENLNIFYSQLVEEYNSVFNDKSGYHIHL